MGILVPSLTSQGFLTELSEKADKLFAYYITSEYSQSQVYFGNVTSLPYHIQTYGNDLIQLENRIREDLIRYFNRYFTNTVVEVRTDVPEVTDPDRINLSIDVLVTEDGKQYSLGREIKILNSKVTQIIDLYNGV